ncbi:MAG: histidine phosphatase family protein [Leptolyngbya sp.]|nr:histidine phosphatase family protein [Leptolyngbya sp.]
MALRMHPLRLLLIRHGQSQGNVEGRMEGWSSTGLTDLGRKQAQQLGQRLAQENKLPTHIYCSPLQRATETLAAMASELWPRAATPTPSIPISAIPVPTVLHDDLRENHQGILTGLTWAEAQTQYPDLCQRLETSLDWVPIPEAESWVEGHQRAQRFVDDLFQQHRNGDRVWVISHQWILQHILACLLGGERTWGIPFGHTAVTELRLDHDRWFEADPTQRLNTELWRIQRFNDDSHAWSTDKPG